MPHVIVKLWPGKSEKQKRQLAEQSEDVMNVLELRGRVRFGAVGRSSARGVGGEGL